MISKEKLSFDEYLNLEDPDNLPEGRCEFIDGELVELPPESEPNDWIAQELFWLLANTGSIPRRLIRPHSCEIEVIGKPRTRYPDLVILQEEHLGLTQKRFTITLEMPPPQLVAEVVSPGQNNRNRDYKDKLAQYQRRGIPEYWLIDPEWQAVVVLKLEDEKYSVVGTFQGNNQINSPTFPDLITAEQIFWQ